MKICIIGSSGHWPLALDSLSNHTLVGVAPGYEGENMDVVIQTLNLRGITAELFTDYHDLIDISEVAVVNTHHDLNAVVTAEFLKKDVYVYCEKPLATDFNQLKMLERVAKKSKAFVCAMFNIRCSDWFMTVKKEVETIGQIRMINARKSYKFGIHTKRKSAFGGIIPWVAIHAIDWIAALSGENFRSVSALSNRAYNHDNGDYEMTAICQFEMENDIIASITADFYRPQGAPTHGDDRVRVVGTDGIVECADGQVTRIDENGVTVIPLEQPEDSFGVFIRRIEGEDVGPDSRDSLSATYISLLAREAADEGKRKTVKKYK